MMSWFIVFDFDVADGRAKGNLTGNNLKQNTLGMGTRRFVMDAHTANTKYKVCHSWSTRTGVLIPTVL